MSKASEKLYIIFIDMFLLAFPLLVLSCSAQPIRPPPAAEKGLLSLSNLDMEEKKVIPLSGEWEFYWKQLLEPEDFHQNSHPSMTGFIMVPGTWNDLTQLPHIDDWSAVI